MLITYLRSSSYNDWDYCQLKYYINYVLGWQFPAGKAADKGTIVHKVMECLATAKKEYQDSGKKKFTIEDKQLGKINIDTTKWLTPKKLTEKQIFTINESRKNKSTYKTPAELSEGHTRLGIPLVKELIERSFEYYSSKTNHKWYPIDFKDCSNWTWMGLDYCGGMFDPRKRKIVETEPHFDFEINKPWAEYEYTMPDGKKSVGKLAIKGTIDLITEVEDGIIEVVDWKTGQRLNWATGNTKTYDKLKDDPQLMIYFLAISKMYPKAKEIILTIFFIRDGGPFSICVEKVQLEGVEDMLKDRFLEIKSSKNPKMFDPTQKHFKCSKICQFYKNKFDGDSKNICKTINEEIETYGLDFTTINRTKQGHTVGTYNAPGE